VHDTTKEAAAGYITEIQNFMNDLNSQNLKLAELPDLLRESKKLFGKNDFDGVKKNYDSAKKIFDEAIESLRKSRSVSGLVALASSGGLLTPGTDRLLLLAQLALARGDYALALERLREAELTYALETKGEFNLFIWVLGNLDRVFVMLVLFVLAVYLFYLGVSLLRINSGLRELNSENSLLLGLIASLQRKSFVENKMSLGEYYDSLGQFERRISEVSEHIIELTTKKNNLFAFTSSVTRLGEEKKSLLELIRDTQKQYFNLGLIETRIYSARTGSLTKRLSEVEEQLVTNDLKKTIRLNTRGAQKYFWKAYYKIFR
jgi:tetratricopeptide (TPR) repeat protein